MIAQIVVGDAGVLIDRLRGAMWMLGIDLGRDEHRGVAERARVEDRRDLADDALVEKSLHAAHRLRFVDPGELRHLPVGSGREREAALHEVEQLAVELVEWNRGAVLAAADLGCRRRDPRAADGAGLQLWSASHRAASFAW